jgi:hypothetical protein
MMRLKVRAELLVSKSDAEVDDPIVYRHAADANTILNQSVVKENENWSLANINASKVIREVFTALC